MPVAILLNFTPIKIYYLWHRSLSWQWVNYILNGLFTIMMVSIGKDTQMGVRLTGDLLINVRVLAMIPQGVINVHLGHL